MSNPAVAEKCTFMQKKRYYFTDPNEKPRKKYHAFCVMDEHMTKDVPTAVEWVRARGIYNPPLKVRNEGGGEKKNEHFPSVFQFV